MNVFDEDKKAVIGLWFAIRRLDNAIVQAASRQGNINGTYLNNLEKYKVVFSVCQIEAYDKI